jgi:hypothetical protein
MILLLRTERLNAYSAFRKGASVYSLRVGSPLILVKPQ